jgi:4'-phosphopantetheinyl transferase EntD
MNNTLRQSNVPILKRSAYCFQPDVSESKKAANRTSDYSAIRKILPPGAVGVENFGTLHGDLLREEEELLGHAVPKRIGEFAAGRTCARRALELLGFPVHPIGRGPDREPIWPVGIVGSITHCEGYCAAALARATEISSIGIDAEPNEPLAGDVLKMIGRDEEMDTFNAQFSGHEINWGKLLFSAKESFYKAWFPIAKIWLDFKEVKISPHLQSGDFGIDVCRTNRIDDTGTFGLKFGGQFALHDGLLLTSVFSKR